MSYLNAQKAVTLLETAMRIVVDAAETKEANDVFMSAIIDMMHQQVVSIRKRIEQAEEPVVEAKPDSASGELHSCRFIVGNKGKGKCQRIVRDFMESNMDQVEVIDNDYSNAASARCCLSRAAKQMYGNKVIVGMQDGRVFLSKAKQSIVA